MPVTLRSPLAMGVALVGASAIALTPISAVPTELPTPAIQSTAVQLTAAVDPLNAWVSLFGNTLTSATALGQQIVADPAPILTQVLRNQAANANTVAGIVSQVGSGLVQWATVDVPMYLEMAADLAQQGKYDQAIMNALAMPVFAMLFPVGIPLMGLSSITVGITENLYNVAQTIANPMTLLGTVLGTMQVWSSATGELGKSVQSIADAVKAGDAQAAVNALLAAPALIANAVINGTENTPGILTPESASGHPLPGPIAGVMVQVRRAIAQALGAPAPTSTMALRATPDSVAPDSPAALPSATANTVAVSLTKEPDTKTTVEAPASEAPAGETPKTDTTGDTVTEKATNTETNEKATVSDEATATTVDTSADSTSTRGVGATAKTQSAKPAEKTRGDIKKSVDSVGKKVNSTVSKIRDGLKKGISKPAKPSTKKADSGAGSASSGEGSE
ncbi:hypothetical protein [Mycolicibacterium lutetiense]